MKLESFLLVALFLHIRYIFVLCNYYTYKYNFYIKKSPNSVSTSTKHVFLPVYSSIPLNITSNVENIIIIVHGSADEAAEYFYDVIDSILIFWIQT